MIENSTLEQILPKPLGNIFKKDNLGSKLLSGRIMDLSIIVPCYNVEKYVKECLDSIIKQKTQYTFEIILINDGSTDNTHKILQYYNGIKNIRLINQKNKGLSGARNTALNYVQGVYLMFVDSDDRLCENAIEILCSTAYKFNADIVEGGYIKFYHDKILYIEKNNQVKRINPVTDVRGFAWGKIIRSELFNDIIFPESYWFEDTILKYLIYTRVKKAIALNDIVYMYRHNMLGISFSSKRNIKAIDSTWITELVIDNFKRFNILITPDIYNELINQLYINCDRVFFLDYSLKRKVYIYQHSILMKLSKHKIKTISNYILFYLIKNENIRLLNSYILINKIYKMDCIIKCDT